MPRYFFSSTNILVCQIKKLSQCTQSQTLLKSNKSRRERVICISAAALGDHCSTGKVENVVFFFRKPKPFIWLLTSNVWIGCCRLLHFDSIVYYLFEDFTLLIRFNLFERRGRTCQDVKHSKALQMKLPIHLVKSKHLIGLDRNPKIGQYSRLGI